MEKASLKRSAGKLSTASKNGQHVRKGKNLCGNLIGLGKGGEFDTFGRKISILTLIFELRTGIFFCRDHKKVPA